MGTFAHMGTFAAKEVSAGRVYGMNGDGSAFDDNSTYATVMPFRTYLASSSGNTRGVSVIPVAEGAGLESLPGEEREVPGEEWKEPGEESSSDFIKVRAIGHHAIKVESTHATRLHVFTPTGQLYRILDVSPGTATYSGFPPGLYLFGTTKLMVK